MITVLEHIVRVHRRVDKGLENEIVVVLFISSVLCCRERMDDENICLFESLQEGIDVFEREVVAVGRGGKVLRDSLVVNKYPPLRRPLGREGHKLVEPPCEFVRHISKGRFDPRVLGIHGSLAWEGSVPPVDDRSLGGNRSRGRQVRAVLMDRETFICDGGRAARREWLHNPSARRLWVRFRGGGLNGIWRVRGFRDVRGVSKAPLGAHLSATVGGVPLGEALVVLVKLLFRVLPTPAHSLVERRHNPVRTMTLEISDINLSLCLLR